jgi:para-nitrobenzyl esterase
MTALGAVMAVKSGPVSYSDAAPLAEAETKGQKLGTLKSLREMPVADLLKIIAAPQMSIGPANGVIVDGWVLPKPPAEVFAAGQEHRVPLLIGNNSRERTPPPAAPEDLRHAIEAVYGPLAPRAFELYGGDATQWVVDTMYRCPVVAQLLWQTSKNPAWEYEFDLGRATHGAEVPYVFGPAADPNIQTYWTNFAKTGNPNGPGSPEWPAFDPKNRQYIEFTKDGPVAGDHLRRNFCNLYVENVNRLIGH